MKLSTAALLASIGPASAFFGQAPLTSFSGVRQSSHTMEFSQSNLDAVNGSRTKDKSYEAKIRLASTQNNMSTMTQGNARGSTMNQFNGRGPAVNQVNGRGPATMTQENTRGFTMNQVNGRGTAANQVNGRGTAVNQVNGRGSTMNQVNGRAPTMNQVNGRGSTMNQVNGRGSTMNQVNGRGSTMNQVNVRGSTMNQVNVRGSTMNQVNGRGSTMTQTNGLYANQAQRIMLDTQEVMVQGGSLRTWSYPSPMVENVQVVLATEGRPMDADVELWQGPDNTPVKMRVYVEDGALRPFSTIIDTPRGPNTISVRNVGQIEFPLASYVAANVDDSVARMMADPMSSSMTIQGGALRTFPFDPSVESVAVMINTDGRPLNARIELLQGPNNNKQVVELYTEDGMDRPFFCVIASPGSGNVVRIVNTSPVEFPMTAVVEANEINTNYSAMDPVLGGDYGYFMDRSTRF